MKYIIILVIVVIILGALFSIYRSKKNQSANISYGEIVTYEKDTPIIFKDFKLVYVGGVDKTPPEVTATIHEERFSLISLEGGKNKLITVTSGQLPPEPQQFDYGHSRFTIWTYETKDGKRLGKNQVVVSFDSD